MSEHAPVEPGQVLPATELVRDRIARRWEGLNERVQAKVQSISGLDRTPEVRLIQQASSAGTVTKRLSWLRKAADHVHAGAAHLAACRKGCAHCCHIAVTISRAEAQVIARETGAKLNPKAGVFSMADSEDFGEAFKQATSGAVGKPCTFLTEGSCSIYAHRPLTCCASSSRAAPPTCPIWMPASTTSLRWRSLGSTRTMTTFATGFRREGRMTPPARNTKPTECCFGRMVYATLDASQRALCAASAETRADPNTPAKPGRNTDDAPTRRINRTKGPPAHAHHQAPLLQLPFPL